MAAETRLSVSGHVRPPSCTMQLPQINHGAINLHSLSPTGFSQLSPTTFELSIHCAGPASFALSFRDRRAGSVPDGIEAELGERTLLFGLGRLEGKSIGAYALRFLWAHWDGPGVAYGISRVGADGSWADDYGSMINPASEEDRQYSWSRPRDMGAPGMFRVLQANLVMLTALNPTEQLPGAATGLTLDGEATVTLFYL
ncbi:DUF1120 domain-containing protein [Pseudomonas sp. HR96]|uniref:DUF1120 domain-containing protein n=1 Tax=Pseudomonas sp. HR96 TaxID=1027966 RepID=UPI002A75BB0C|nr:DUF1120 domain-containing protein [Pseudomonas sp. HR96]WPP01895.1 DUF1120 domain-containing protein [Pseudomonas sp. HR96]